MPGLLNMDSAASNGVRTDHDRDAETNGAGLVMATASQDTMDKLAAKATAEVKDGETDKQSPAVGFQRTLPLRMNDLPDELSHITLGFIPLATLFTRLAQFTHNSLQEKVVEMAKMPLPSAAMNGNASHTSSGPDDASTDNLRKKTALLNWAQEFHAKWVKALVIAEWSRKGHLVSKLIDLKFHLDQQRMKYDASLDNIVNVKRDLTFARLPSPDLKTALQILSTGTAPWLPDLGYISPPPLTLEEQLRWTEELDTQLALRLNMADYEKTPHHFRDFEISSGRVTFKVPGEFEVDLTIADDDFEKQFWFIDFRFDFSPAPAAIPDSLRMYLDQYVNDALAKDGLQGCYQVLHELVLTSKINELKHQAAQLSRNAWTGFLMVEPLHRALAIQYWTTKTEITGLKSWVMVAIHSGKLNGDQTDSRSTSFLEATWYRDGKVMKEVDISFDLKHLSAEDLLRSVIGRHTEYLLSVVSKKLMGAPRYKSNDSEVSLKIAPSDPASSSLEVHIGRRGTASLSIEPTTGFFAVGPPSKFSVQQEHRLNNGKTPAEDGMLCLENIRCAVLEDELQRRATCKGWQLAPCPVNNEEAKAIMKGKDWTRNLWFKREGLTQSWHVAVFLSLAGDEWWLVDTTREERTRSLAFQSKLPMVGPSSGLSDAFWQNLTTFVAGVITQAADMRELQRERIKARRVKDMSTSMSQALRLPHIEVSLSSISPTMALSAPLSSSSGDDTFQQGSNGLKHHWANDVVSIRFKGVEATVGPGPSSNGAEPAVHLRTLTHAIIKVRRPAKFEALKGTVDPEVTYNSKSGEFILRMVHDVGAPFVHMLKTRVQAVDRFVSFLEAMENAKGMITSEKVTLRSIVFSYGSETAELSHRWKVFLNLSKEDMSIRLEKGNPHLMVVDLMQALANQPGGIGALMAWLPHSLSTFVAMDNIQAGWDDIETTARGRIEFTMKTLDWIGMRYVLPRPSKKGQSNKKVLSLEAKLKQRRGQMWWHLGRSDGSISDDDFLPVLKPIFEGNGEDWHGLSTGAAGLPGKGLVNMLQAVDETIKVMVSSTTPRMKTKGKGAANNAVVLD